VRRDAASISCTLPNEGRYPPSPTSRRGVMNTVLQLALAFLVTLVVLWAALLAVLLLKRPRDLPLSEMVLLMPELVRLVAGLARDPALPRHIRARLWLLIAFMASPIDLIPDLIPVIGFADDIILAYLVLRSVVRAAGPGVLTHHWSGTPEGLTALEQLLNV
jgi:uncharacterized membrane protein YkvA (DUF1232 family)